MYSSPLSVKHAVWNPQAWKEGTQLDEFPTLEFRTRSPQIRQTPHVEQTTQHTHRHLDDVPSGQSIEQSGGVLMSFRQSMSGHTVFHVTPTVRGTRRNEGDGVTTSTSNLRYNQSSQSIDTFRSTASGFVAVSEFPIHATTPCVQGTICRNGGGVVRSTRHMRHHLSGKGLDDPRHVLPSIVAMTQTSVVAPTWCLKKTEQEREIGAEISESFPNHNNQGPCRGQQQMQTQQPNLARTPCVHFTVGGQDDRVTGSTSNLLDANPAEGINLTTKHHPNVRATKEQRSELNMNTHSARKTRTVRQKNSTVVVSYKCGMILIRCITQAQLPNRNNKLCSKMRERWMRRGMEDKQ